MKKNHTMIILVFILFCSVILFASCMAELVHTNDTPDKVLIANGIEKCIDFHREYPDSIDPYNFFGSSPNYPHQILVDTIIFRSDSLFGIAFFVLKIHKADHISNLGKALVVYRETKDSSFALYPLPQISSSGSSYEKAMHIVKYEFTNNLGTMSDNQGQSYKCNVGSPDFWENSLLFTRVTDGYYYFQTRFNYYKAQMENKDEYYPVFYPKCDKVK